MSKKELEKPPSVDRSDPAVMRRAAGIAKRRNNRVRAKVPLFADQLPQVTAEDVIRQREQGREAYAAIWREHKATEEQQILDWQAEILAAVGSQEYARLVAKVTNNSTPVWIHWMGIRDRVRQRACEVMPENADLVLAWLGVWEGDPPTHYELHQRCGDGLSLEQVREALGWLAHREFIEYGTGRACTVSGVPLCVTWRVPSTYAAGETAARETPSAEKMKSDGDPVTS